MDNQEIASFRRAIQQVVKDIFILFPCFLVCKAQLNLNVTLILSWSTVSPHVCPGSPNIPQCVRRQARGKDGEAHC